jgi:predicted RNase H-like HicB family nuclease
MQKLTYNVIFREEPEGGFTVEVPTLPGCITYGKNLKEAKKMAKDAISGYIQSLIDEGEVVPKDNNNFFTSIEVDKKEGKSIKDKSFKHAFPQKSYL